MKSSRLVIVSAPSGTGKTSIDTWLQRKYHGKVEVVRSCTTRAARSQHAADKDYIFVSREKFQQMLDNDEFLEWAQVFGHFYGTAKKEVATILAQKRIALLEIDVQGGQQVKKIFPRAVSIFILPPMVTELSRRLLARDTDDHEARGRRLHAAYQEIKQGRAYDHFIINDDLEKSCLDLENIVIHHKPGRNSREQGLKMCNKLLEEFRQMSDNIANL